MPRRVAERLRHGLAERDAEILDGVMLIDVEIAVRVDLQVERAVPRERAPACDRGTGCRCARGTPLAVERRSPRDPRLASSADRSPRGAQHLLHRLDAPPRVLDDAGRRPGCSRRSRARSTGRGCRCRARARLRRDPRCAIAGADEHEIRAAPPVLQAEPIARRVQQRLRFAHLPQVFAQVRGSSSAACTAATAAMLTLYTGIACRIGSSRSGAPTRRADARGRPGRYAFENVRPTMMFGIRRQLRQEGGAGEFRVRLVDEDERLGRHARGDRREWLRAAPRRRWDCSGS